MRRGEDQDADNDESGELITFVRMRVVSMMMMMRRRTTK